MEHLPIRLPVSLARLVGAEISLHLKRTFLIMTLMPHLLASLGTVAVFYGVALGGGASFSFSLNNGPSQSCTCWQDDGYQLRYETELCIISGLDGTAQHTLTVTHIDINGSWLSFDYLE